jgi:hypothetical protein
MKLSKKRRDISKIRDYTLKWKHSFENQKATTPMKTGFLFYMLNVSKIKNLNHDMRLKQSRQVKNLGQPRKNE